MYLQSHLPDSGFAVPESLPSPPLSVPIYTNDRHLMSHSFLTTLNWILLGHTPRSLPPLRPCFTSHFTQGWGCECTFRLALPDLGFASPRIIPTSPSSRAIVCFAINSTTQSSRADIPRTHLPLHNANANFLADMHRHPRVPHLFSASLSSCRLHSTLPNPWNTSPAKEGNSPEPSLFTLVSPAIKRSEMAPSIKLRADGLVKSAFAMLPGPDSPGSSKSVCLCST